MEVVRPEADVIPWQRADLRALGATEDACRASVQWISGPGTAPLAESGAIAAVLRAGRRPWRAVGWALTLPGVGPVADAAYRFVAEHRGRLPGVTPALASGEWHGGRLTHRLDPAS